MRELLLVHGISVDEEPGMKATSNFSGTSLVPSLNHSTSYCSSIDTFEASPSVSCKLLTYTPFYLLC